MLWDGSLIGMLSAVRSMTDARERSRWDELTRRLREFVGRRVASSDLDDVLQEALVRIQRDLPKLRDDERFAPRVYRVTRSTIGDHLRARARPLENGRTSVDEEIEAIAEHGRRHP